MPQDLDALLFMVTMQIRVQLAALGHPLLGDAFYAALLHRWHCEGSPAVATPPAGSTAAPLQQAAAGGSAGPWWWTVADFGDAAQPLALQVQGGLP